MRLKRDAYVHSSILDPFANPESVGFCDDSGDRIDLGNASDLTKRVSKFDFAIRIAKLFAEYGKRV